MIAKTLLIAAVSIFAAGSSLAGEVTPDFSRASTSTLTRAEVIAEYVRAKEAGELKNFTGFSTTSDTVSRSTLTRAEVKREYLRARDAGEIALADGAYGVPQQRRAMR